MTKAMVCASQTAWVETAPINARTIQGTNNCTPTSRDMLTTVRVSGTR